MPERFGHYVAFQPSAGGLPTGLVAAGPARPDEPVEVSVYLKPRFGDAAALEDVRERADLRAERERLHAGDIRLLTDFAAAHGLAVVNADPARRRVRLAGPTERMARAFRVTLHRYRHGDGEFRAHPGVLSLPEELAGVVESVLGLDTRPIARRGIVWREATAAQQGFLPNQFATFYGFPASDGRGQAIALIELGGGFREADTRAAFAAMGLAPPKVVAVSVDGGANAPGGGADGEVALDIQVAGGVAPGAVLAVYFSTNTEAGFADAISAAVHDTANAPSVISISWGGAEAAWTPQAATTVNTALRDAASLGVSAFAASGDSLATDGIGDGAAHVIFPASSPWTIGCGGTQTTVSGGAITAQAVWNDGTAGTGGGISDLFAEPTFQASVALPPSVNGGRSGRGVPDVAANAAPASGYAVVADGQALVAGGTSAAAPLWAGLAACINQAAARPIGFFLPAVYGHPELFMEVTHGNNKPAGSPIGYDAGPNWNACTGLGTPRGAALAKALAGTT